MTVAHAPIEVGAAAPQVKLARTSGRPIQLASLWKKRPLVLQFLPPIGSPFGEDDAVRLRDGREAFSKAGAQIVAVCRATSQEAKAFDARWSLGYDLLRDVEGAAFDVFGVTEERPGSFVIETTGALSYVHRNQGQDDSPSMWEIIDAVCDLTGATVERPRLTLVNLDAEDLGELDPSTGVRSAALDFVCGKCGNTSYEVDTFPTASGGVSRLFGDQQRKLSAVSCTNCKYTELYKAEGLSLVHAFEIRATV
ncbi:MAG: zinc ribbon domain-containing protein [Dehalococcoidia bacterium]